MMRLILLALLLLAGCSNNELKDLEDFVKNSGNDLRGNIPPPPEVRPYEPFVYNNTTKLHDPFKPHKPEIHPNDATPNKPDMFRPKEALEEFPLEALRMVGFVYLNKVNNAVIRGPDGKMHRVKAGNYIGMNFGQIQKITEEELTIKEMVQDSVGDWSERISSLKLFE